MNNNLKKVQEFHRVFNQPVLEKCEVISKERAKLRLSLALEELTELAEAFGLASTFNRMMISKATEKLSEDKDRIDRKEVLDALCDIEYINNGTILETGNRFVFDDAFNDVHESNISKVCKTIEEAEETCQSYNNKSTACYFSKTSEYYLVYRAIDAKVLKSINYKEVQLDKYL